MDRGAWWAAVHGVAKSQIRLSDFTFTFHFHALEKDMATHSSVLAWRIPGTGEPSGLPSMGSHRVGHDWSDLAAAAAAVAGWNENKPQFPLLALSLRGGWQACCLYPVRVEVCSGIRLQGWLGVCPLLRWCPEQGAHTVLCFCSGLFKSSSVVFWSLCILRVQNSNCEYTWIFLIPYSFFLFCSQGEVCPGANTSALPRRVPGPSLSYFQPLELGKNKFLW